MKEEETQRRIEEASRAPNEMFKMKKFQNVESRIKGEMQRQSLRDDLNPVIHRPATYGGRGIRANSGARLNSQRTSQKLLTAGGGILGIGGGTPKGTGGIRTSGSARGPIGQMASTGGATGLNKNMLNNLNK